MTQLDSFKIRKGYILPTPPFKFEEITQAELDSENGQKKMTAYAQALIKDFCFSVLHSTNYMKKFAIVLNFWGISKSFCYLKCQKLAEFTALKLAQGRANNNCTIKTFKRIFSHYQKKWICVGFNNVWYYGNSNDHPSKMRDSIPLDMTCHLKILSVHKSYIEMELLMSRRKLAIKVVDFTNGLNALRSLVKAFMKSQYSFKHRFDSFAPPRQRNDCDFFVDGDGYFAKLHENIKNAKFEVLMCGWFISPEMPLVRPVNGSLQDDSTRLDRVLKYAADRGVNIYILVYKEVQMSMYNDSEYCKTTLEKLSPNIKVMRHPTKVISFWSHHEKMVIIDRKTVMMGGLDITWGRWDTNEHRLFDYTEKRITYPNIDYYNPFKKDILHGRLFEKSMIDKSDARMPWHDVAVMLRGPIVFDFLTHFTTYWNNARELNNEKEVLFSQVPLKDQRLYLNTDIINGLRNMLKISDLTKQKPQKTGGSLTQNDLRDAQELHEGTQDDNEPLGLILNDNRDVDESSEDLNPLHDLLFQKEDLDLIRNEKITLPKDKTSPQNSLHENTQTKSNSGEDDEDQDHNMDYGQKLFKNLDLCYEEVITVEVNDIEEEVHANEPLVQGPAVFIPKPSDEDHHRPGNHQFHPSKKPDVQLNSAQDVPSPGLGLVEPPGSPSKRDREIVGHQNKLPKPRGPMLLAPVEVPTDYIDEGGKLSEAVRELADNQNKYQADPPLPKRSTNAIQELRFHSTDHPEAHNNKPQAEEQPSLRKIHSKSHNLTIMEPMGSKIHRSSRHLQTVVIGDPRFNITQPYDLSQVHKDEVLFPDKAEVSHQNSNLHEPSEQNHHHDQANSLFVRGQRRATRLKSVYQIQGAALEMQALRSASPWSVGLYEKEYSIQNCYIETILNAKRYIYIENQFFISSTQSNTTTANAVKNRVVKAIYMRIREAIKHNESFKVIVFMPLLPAFEADLVKKEGKVMQIQLALENSTIGQGPNSLIEKIRKLTPNPEEYIIFCGLRKWDYMPKWASDAPVGPQNPANPADAQAGSRNGPKLDMTHQKVEPLRHQELQMNAGEHSHGPSLLEGDPEKPVTELIYIHSKVVYPLMQLMIVDDTHLLMGSANLNDRSLWGSRDSELAVFIKGNLDYPISFNGAVYNVNRKIHEFRSRIFMEHFGLTRDEVVFPSSNYFWAQATNITTVNTEIYDQVFKVYPSNRFKDWKSLAEEGHKPPDLEAFRALHKHIKGHAVIYPYGFLCKEHLMDAKSGEFALRVMPVRVLT